MVCKSMVEDKGEGSLLNTQIAQMDDQFTCSQYYPPKVRKTYTITKQRERWTQEDHQKFLEALKLHGRAWRRIQEHVGNKTAIQIRSHAQKFFSKVGRESEVDPIEIPPPRAKRKPMHPYPRKVSAPLEKEGHGGLARSTSPNSSGSDHENRSPTSVLSAGGCGSDPCSPNGGSLLAENRPNGNLGPMKGSGEAVATQSLKLFGKTFFVYGDLTLTEENDAHKGFAPYKRCLA